MCGIFGASRRTPAVERMLPFLAWEMEERGDDSWGVTDGTPEHVIKHLGPITGSFELPQWPALLYHTRRASTGKVTLDNQHPWIWRKTVEGEEGGLIIGVHNGIVANHEGLSRKYKRKFDVDSMHIYAHLAEGKDTAEIAGYGALVWYENETPNGPMQLRFAKFNGGELALFRLKTGEIVYCSTEGPVRKAARMAGVEVQCGYEFKTERLYFVQVEASGEETLMVSGPLRFGYRGFASGNNYDYCGTRTKQRWCPTCRSMVCTCQDGDAYSSDWHDWPCRNAVRGGATSLPFVADPPKALPAPSASAASSSDSGGTSRRTSAERADASQAGHDADFEGLLAEGKHSSRPLVNGTYLCLKCKTITVGKKEALVCKQCLAVALRQAEHFGQRRVVCA
jgi:hypothetical protein